MIHNDLRPANFLLQPQTGRLCLLDVSFATSAAQQAGAEHYAGSGDLAYVSPEQTGRMNRAVDCRTDLYSLGILFYRMLTGRLPFEGKDALEWVHCHIARMPPAISEIAPQIPQMVSDIVMRLLAKLPEDRYQSAHGLLADLNCCLEQWQANGWIESFMPGMQDMPEHFQIAHRLYGRDDEIAQLLRDFERMAASGRATLVTVSGYSGIGKSSLVRELQKPIVRQHGCFISGKFEQYQRDIPYATLTQAFRELVQQLLAESEASIANWRQRIAEAVGVNGQLIVDVLPQVELIIGKQEPVTELPLTEAQHRFHQVFRQFLAVFTSKEHPLALFLDDLQWIDAASLKLIEHLLTHPDTHYLLLIGAYRDNEVNPSHPLVASLEMMRSSGVPIAEIKLAPLSPEHLNQLVADTLHAESASCASLTQLIYERTEGNPFFFTQFLDSLHKEGLLRRDKHDMAWKWSLAQIKARDFADNVVDLMLRKLRQLPQQAQEALRLAACLGNKFDLRYFALVSGNTETEAEQCLAAAVDARLLMRADHMYRFLHDRVQEAAYLLIPVCERPPIHLRIGRLLLQSVPAEERDERIFEIVDHLNMGAHLMRDPADREELARLNLAAAAKAKASTAYAAAARYLRNGMSLLVADAWTQQYGLSLALHRESAEVEYLEGNFEVSETMARSAIAHARTHLEKAEIYLTLIVQYTLRAMYPQAIQAGREALSLIRIDLPQDDLMAARDAEMAGVKAAIGDRPIASLADLPDMTHPEARVAMELLTAMGPPTYRSHHALWSILCSKAVNLCLKHGNAPQVAYSYTAYGGLLGYVADDYRAGAAFGDLALRLSERFGNPSDQSVAYLMEGSSLRHWSQHLRHASDDYNKAYGIGLTSGNLQYAAYAFGHNMYCRFYQGIQLEQLLGEVADSLSFSRYRKNEWAIDMLEGGRLVMLNLSGRTGGARDFSTAGLSEEQYLRNCRSNRNAQVECIYHILKTQALYLMGEVDLAFECSRRAEEAIALVATQGLLPAAEHRFFESLILTALYAKLTEGERPQILAKLEANLRKLKIWADHCPQNFCNRFALVSAEVARITGEELKAERLYEEAIRSARENAFVQNEGIAHELAARFYRQRGFDRIADAYLREARACYARWGADGKIRQLDAHLQPGAAAQGGMAQLDVLAVAKASQAISGRIVLSELIETLMRIVLENAGAQSGWLLLARGTELVLAADASVERQTIQVRVHIEKPAPEFPLARSVIHYVQRTREQVLLSDMAQPNPFSGDPCFAQRQPKSVLCLPLLRQGNLLGVLYLEHGLVTNAFTPAHQNVLELLASQAAISLENALLYDDLRQENSERERAQQSLREREARIRRLVESNIIGIMFWEAHGGVLDANDAFLHLTGYRREDLNAGKILWDAITPPEYRDIDMRALAEVQRTGTCTPFEKEFIRKDGSHVPVLVGPAAFEGSQEHGVAFVLDLTEHKRAEEALRKAHEELEMRVRERTQELARSNAELEQMAYVASHDLQEPLRMVASYLQLLEKRYKDRLGKEANEFIDFAVDAAKRMQALIDDLLAYSRLGTKTKPFELIDCDAVLAIALRSLHAAIAESNARIHCQPLPQIMGDAMQLAQLFQNLIGNSLKFRGEHAPEIHIDAGREDGFWKVSVRDNGIGIAPEYFERIFVMFQRLHSRSKYPGTGIGLALCKKIVEHHGGRIWVESTRGQGSTFSFTLPVAKELHHECTAGNASDRDTDSGRQSGRCAADH